jgi:hypothetical protein
VKQAAAILSREAGEPILYTDADPDEWVRGAVASGAPQDYMEMLAFLFSLIRDGVEARTSDGVQRALGRPGRRSRPGRHARPGRCARSRGTR